MNRFYKEISIFDSFFQSKVRKILTGIDSFIRDFFCFVLDIVNLAKHLSIFGILEGILNNLNWILLGIRNILISRCSRRFELIVCILLYILKLLLEGKEMYNRCISFYRVNSFQIVNLHNSLIDSYNLGQGLLGWNPGSRR